MHGKAGLRVFMRDGFQRCGVGADGHHAQTGQIAGTFQAQTGLLRNEARGIRVRHREPAGVEKHHVALADLHAGSFRCRIDLPAVEGCACGHGIRTQLPGHVQQHAP
jgi:hypothetical protein